MYIEWYLYEVRVRPVQPLSEGDHAPGEYVGALYRDGDRGAHVPVYVYNASIT